MSRAVPEAPATHFRLSQDSWAQIAEAYRNGATARELAARWKVSPTTIYRYACRDGFTKKRDSDAIARAHAQMIADEEAADLAGGALGAADLPDATPAALKRRALEDMARAMAAGRVAEADRLGRLLLTLGKVSGSRDDDDMDDGEAPRKVGPIKTTLEQFVEAVFPLVEEVALKLLGDRYHGPAVFSRAAMRWRAATFGPECAANDYREMCAAGWTDGVYDEDGNILPGWGSSNMRHPQVDAPPGYKGFEAARGG
jgi:hypothetical protein